MKKRHSLLLFCFGCFSEASEYSIVFMFWHSYNKSSGHSCLQMFSLLCGEAATEGQDLK